MARIRTIKPEFFTSSDIVELSPLARLFYIGLWCEADKEGRMSWKPKTFKMRYFPGDDCSIEALCEELTSAGLVVLYGDGLAHIPFFAKHQHVNPRESASTHGSPGHSLPVKALLKSGGHSNALGEGIRCGGSGDGDAQGIAAQQTAARQSSADACAECR